MILLPINLLNMTNGRFWLIHQNHCHIHLTDNVVIHATGIRSLVKTQVRNLQPAVTSNLYNLELNSILLQMTITKLLGALFYYHLHDVERRRPSAKARPVDPLVLEGSFGPCGTLTNKNTAAKMTFLTQSWFFLCWLQWTPVNVLGGRTR